MSFSRFNILTIAFITSLFVYLPSISAQEEIIPDPAVVDDIGGVPITIHTEGYVPVRIPLAVPDAMNQGAADSSGAEGLISRTLQRDFELAGLFQLLLHNSYFFDQHADGMTTSTVDFENWFNVGAQGVVKTAFQINENEVQVDFRLFNVDSQTQIPLDFSAHTIPLSEIESEVHRFANMVIEYYTGYTGPFGSTVAFVGRGRNGSREIYTLRIGSDGVSQATQDRDINILPQWAGHNLAYTSYVRGNPDLAIGTGSDRIFISRRPGINSGGALSPDGSALVVSLSMNGNSEIYLLNPDDGSIISRLTNNRFEDVSPCWSPDGSQISYVSDGSGGPQIYIMNRDGSGQRRLTFLGRYNTTPDWSPDGTRIAFTGRDSRNRFDIFTVEVSTSHIERLTQDQGNNEGPTWSANGQYLIFSSTRGSMGTRLYIATQDGNFQTLLTPEGSGYSMPAWQR